MKPSSTLRFIDGQEEMHLTAPGIALCQSFRAEQTAVLGFLLSMDRLLTFLQRACLEVSSYPWSPEWLKLCALICQRRGLEALVFPTFGNQQLNLPILPHKTAFEVSRSIGPLCNAMLTAEITNLFAS